jgi:hypothetical protein
MAGSWRELILVDFLLLGWTALFWVPLVLVAFAIGRRLQIGWRFLAIAALAEVAAIAIQIALRYLQTL